MCGIAGFLSVHAAPSPALLQSMMSVLAHRGPDDTGMFTDETVALGHTRLSIIDLSEHAHQPMSNETGEIWLIFNGEIYNHVELAEGLRRRGHQLKSRSDSEVILHLYEERGARCVEQLNGMFAFVIWDSRKRLLFAARDRMGIKPLYYWQDATTLVFGSEIKALLRHPAVHPSPDRQTVFQYLQYQTKYGDATWYQGVRELLPGHTMTWEAGKLRLRQYWDITFDPDFSRSYGSFREELRSLLDDATRLHVRSDVPVGAHLSGGIDSSSVVVLAARYINRIHTFSGAYDEGQEYDERAYIRQVVAQVGSQHHETVPEATSLPVLLPKLIWHLDEPVAGPGSFSQYHVCKLVRGTGIKVVLGGQGGDELFGGYIPYYALALRNMRQHLLQPAAFPPFSELLMVPRYVYRYSKAGRLQLVKKKHPHDGQPLYLPTAAERDGINAARSIMMGRIAKLEPFEAQAYQHLRQYLPSLLHVEDRTSMACSLESRVPLLDYRIVELAARMPSWMKVKHGTLKYLFRDVMRGKVPNAILQRRDKMGFPTPVGDWFAGPLADWVHQQLNHHDLRVHAFVNRSQLEKAQEEHRGKRCDHGIFLWKMVNLELWLAMVEG